MYKFYPKTVGHEENLGFSAEEIRLGHHWIYADVVCDNCGKEYHVSQDGKNCRSCGEVLKG